MLFKTYTKCVYVYLCCLGSVVFTDYDNDNVDDNVVWCSERGANLLPHTFA
jgi:hypothetical protein